MFHCNGWMFTWTMANLAGCNFLVRAVRPDVISDLVDRCAPYMRCRWHVISESVTPTTSISLLHRHEIPYMLGAPILMTAMLSHPARKKFRHRVQMLTGGAPPPPVMIQRFLDELGVEAKTGYGLTESYGAASTYLPDPEWKSERIQS